jgi:hypothetical protein
VSLANSPGLIMRRSPSGKTAFQSAWL